ncbi:hypothetical protein GF336_00240 [Candidatus Woesearchaeota archaeon]|nr:hypothetical protein [Candidatus Woesearchaeota archaeon]
MNKKRTIRMDDREIEKHFTDIKRLLIDLTKMVNNEEYIPEWLKEVEKEEKGEKEDE